MAHDNFKARHDLRLVPLHTLHLDTKCFNFVSCPVKEYTGDIYYTKPNMTSLPRVSFFSPVRLRSRGV